MKIFYTIISFLCIYLQGNGQDAVKLIATGNEAYRQQQYDKAVLAYKQALELDPNNTTALYNLGNALFRDKKYEEASVQFDALARTTVDKELQAKSLYNKGVSFSQQKKLEESIEAYKQTLRLNNKDTLARENLQRALNEKKQQQPPPQQNNQQQHQENQPRPKPNKLNKQEAERLLKALEEQEKKLQERVMKKHPTTGQPDKDW